MFRMNAGVRLGLETLESREVPAVINVYQSGAHTEVITDNNSTNVEIRQSGNRIEILDHTANRSWFAPVNPSREVRVFGGEGHDRIINNVASYKLVAVGNGGNDYLEGYNQGDAMFGGNGNDVLVGYAGNDYLDGGNGNDLIKGMGGDDALLGGAGDDEMIGAAGTDNLYGQDGNDTLVAIDNDRRDYLDGGLGFDAIWVDSINVGYQLTDNYSRDGADRVHAVGNFANGADRTLDGDRIADPTDGRNYKNFASQRLFASTGPGADDIRQGQLADCWILGSLSAVALERPATIRQTVADFGDGTYGVRLGDNFYRVDADLPTHSAASSSLTNAGLGRENSLWVAIVEKAYVSYRTGANTYASLGWGNPLDAFRSMGFSSLSNRWASSYDNATAMANHLAYQLANDHPTTYSTRVIAANSPLVSDHVYTVSSVNRNAAGAIVSITLRNPWGTDGPVQHGADDGYVTLTPQVLYGMAGLITTMSVAV